MKYRAKCTWCLSQIANLYNKKTAYLCHDKTDTWIEVNTEEEAELIEELNKQLRKTTETYTRLRDITTNNK